MALSMTAAAQGPFFTQLRQMLPTDPITAGRLAIGDFDGDGSPDLAAEQLFLNDGSGFYWLATPRLPANVASGITAAGDVDGDGDIDLLIAHPAGRQLLLNDGSASFVDASAQLPVQAWRARDLVLADLDGDGDLDAIVLAHHNDGVSTVWQNLGGGSFSVAWTFSMPATDLDLGDLDGDGDLDMAISCDEECDPYGCYEADNRVLRNLGGLVFSQSNSFLPGFPSFSGAIAIGDVDGDGDLDIVAGNSGPDDLYLNDGASNFSVASSQLPHATWATTGLALGDVDGDGDLDIVAGRDYMSALLLNDGSGNFVAANDDFLVKRDPTADVALFDVDGDLDLDLLIQNGQDQVDRLFLNDGAGGFRVMSGGLPADAEATRSLAIGDLDGDGDPDLLFGNGYEPALHLNDGGGVFIDSSALLPTPTSPFWWTEALALGDVDGDGDLDALLGRGDDLLYLNQGDASFLDASSQIPSDNSDRTRGAALVDVDGDLDLDVVLANGSQAGLQNRLYLNDGSGFFVGATHQLPTALDPTGAVAHGDIDGDGDVDLLFCDGVLRVYQNDGSGWFSDVSAAAAGFAPAYQVRLHDLNGDGALDVLSDGSVLLNDGSGQFTPLVGAVSFSGALVACADADEDGDLDILAGVSGGPELHLNDGSGMFSEAVGSLFITSGGQGPQAVAFQDLDGDGDPDALVANFFRQNRLYTNLRRNLSRRGLPRFGQRLDLDILGPPQQAWILALSPHPGSVSLPPWGELRLDLPTTIVLASGTLGPQGHATLGFTLPPTAGPVPPLSYFTQALVGTTAPRFTNLEVLSLTGF